MSQKYGHGSPWPSFSRSLMRLPSKCCLRLRSHLKAWLERTHIQAHIYGFWQDQIFLLGLLDQGPRFLVGSWLEVVLPCGPPLHANMLQQSQQRRGSAGKREVTILYNIIMELTSHHLCHIPWARSTLEIPPIVRERERGILKAMNIRGHGSLGAILPSYILSATLTKRNSYASKL